MEEAGSVIVGLAMFFFMYKLFKLVIESSKS